MSDTVKPIYTEKDIIHLRASARHYKLTAPDEFWSKSTFVLCDVCNGAGPERWSEDKRKALTEALSIYETAFAIHDVDYRYHVTTQKAADKRLYKNMIKIWRKNFGIWRWLSKAGRIERLVVIPAIYAAVILGGNQAWEESENNEQDN